jgi:uncharacterized membrane protein
MPSPPLTGQENRSPTTTRHWPIRGMATASADVHLLHTPTGERHMARTTLTLALALATLAGGLAMPAFAHDHGRGGRGPIGRIVHALDTLDLDADQEAALDDLMATLRADRPDHDGRSRGDDARGEHARGDRARGERTRADRPEVSPEMREERRARFATLTAQLGSPTPDAVVLHDLLDEGRRGPAPARAHEHLDQVLGFHATLTDPQRAALVEELEARRGRHGDEDRGHRGRGRRGGRED